MTSRIFLAVLLATCAGCAVDVEDEHAGDVAEAMMMTRPGELDADGSGDSDAQVPDGPIIEVTIERPIVASSTVTVVSAGSPGEISGGLYSPGDSNERAVGGSGHDDCDSTCVGGKRCKCKKNRQEEFCDSLLNSDMRTCGRLKTKKGKDLCIASALQRYGSCLAGKPLADLVTWVDDDED